MATIKLKNGSGAPLASDLVQGEPALDLTNKRLYTEDTLGAVIEVGVNPTELNVTNNIVVGGTVDGRDIATDGAKLDNVEAGATADQTPAQIKTAYESNADTNAFTDADHTKLDGVEALADVTDTTNVTAAGALMDSELTSEASVKALNQGVATTDSPTFAGLTTTADVTFGDNDKAIFGAGSDLQVYHSGSHSYIDEVGTGSLYVRANDFRLANADGTQNHITTANNGAVSLRYSGSPKLATSSTGIDVTGTVSADGLVSSGSAKIGTGVASNSAKLMVNTGAGESAGIQFFQDGTESWVMQNPASTTALTFSNSNTERLKISNNGDVSLYEDTGTTAKFQWSASDESLSLDKTASGVTKALKLYNNTAGANNRVGIDFHTASTLYGTIEAGYGATSPEMNFKVGGVTPSQILKLNSTGIDVTGVVEATGYLAVEGTSGNTGAGTDRWIGGDGTAGTWFYNVPTGSNHYFAVNNANKLAINSTGIDVSGTVTADALTIGGTLGNFDISAGGNQATFDYNGFNYINFSGSGAVLAVRRTGSLTTTSWSSNGDINLGYEDTGTTAKLFWDASAESLNVGSTQLNFSAAKVQTGSATSAAAGFNVFTSSTGDGYLLFSDGNAGNQAYSGQVRYNHASDFMAFGTAGGAERMRIDSSGHLIVPNGVTLGTAVGTYAAANTLDDYEEGTWTPAYAPSSGSFATIVYDPSTAGSYTKVGNMCTVWGLIRTENVDVTGASGSLLLTGLPFTASGFNGVMMPSLVTNFAANDAPHSGYVQTGGTTINLRKRASSDGSTAGSAASDLNAGVNADHNYMIFAMTYRTA